LINQNKEKEKTVMANTNKKIEIIKALPLTKDEFAKKTFRSRSDVMRLAIATLRGVTDDTYENDFVAREDVEFLTHKSPDMLERKTSG
jgi:hypothetical protein